MLIDMKKLLIGSTRFIVNIQMSNDGSQANDKIWFQYHNWRQILGKDFASSLAVAITIPENLPAKYIWDRWKAEDVIYVIVPTAVFTKSFEGQAELTKKH